jgi:hypothetical protein
VDDDAGKDQMWGSEERGGTDEGLHLYQGDITVDVTIINDKNDVIHNWRINLNCYHNTRGRTRSGRHGISRVSKNTPNSSTSMPICTQTCLHAVLCLKGFGNGIPLKSRYENGNLFSSRKSFKL